ncbi:MAG: PIN domain nuclease [Nitrospirota bacterium]|nr:PIN domain nuclease [Nitrospirota bacterium]MDH5773475.1 PIN domain nuclease [Nitrospirota bacterium]
MADDALAVSAISFLEIVLLHQKERIILTQGVSAWRNQLLEFGLRELPLDGEICIASTTLANFHSDQADRFITASSVFYGASLLTADTRILKWTEKVHRIDASR